MDYKAIADGVYIALSYVAVFVAGWRISHLRTLWASRQCYQEAWSLLRSAEELARLASGGDAE